MIPLLVASAFSLSPPPTVSPLVKPPEDISLVEFLHSDRTLSTPLTHHLMLVGRVARLGPLSTFAIEHREGGFKSGFGLLPPSALPPAPMTTAGFWSMGGGFDPMRFGQGFGAGGLGGGLGGFGGGGGGRGGRGGAGGFGGGGRGGR